MNILRRKAGFRCRKQTGVVMIMTLIALLILLITAVALVRSVDATLGQAGSIAFKRDQANQVDIGLAAAITALSSASGPLYGETVRAASLASANYSAMKLEGNNQGIPLVLVNDTTYGNAGYTDANDIAPKDADGNTMQTTIRYVIDRQCDAAGTFSTIKYLHCSYLPSGGLSGDSSLDAYDNNAGNSDRAIYRITVRVSGPRNTVTYAQATLAL